MCTYRALCRAGDLQAEVRGKLQLGQTNSVAVDCLFKDTRENLLNNVVCNDTLHTQPQSMAFWLSGWKFCTFWMLSVQDMTSAVIVVWIAQESKKGDSRGWEYFEYFILKMHQSDAL